MTLQNNRQLSSGSDMAEIPQVPPTIEDEQIQLNEQQDLTPEQRRAMIGLIIVVILIVAIIVGSIFWLANQPPLKVAMIRDIFIIWMAIMSLLTGIALVILMVQLARLINLMQNELKPILDSLNVTISHLRGTSVFLGDNITEPVIKANEYVAGISQFLAVLGLSRRRSRSSSSNKTKERN